MINAEHLRLHVIRPTLEYLDPVIKYSEAAENLIMGTCAQESNMGEFLVQLGNGPALGIYQMEPSTIEDIECNYLSFRRDLSDRIDMFSGESLPTRLDFVTNLAYATAFCRAHYYRRAEPLPDKDDVIGMSHYWKSYWNTIKGKGTVDQFVENYIHYVCTDLNLASLYPDNEVTE